MTDAFLDILNIGAGHLTFRFDRSNSDEAEKAKKVIGDMLRRGYMLFVKVGNDQKRVRAFDAEHEEYILEEPDELPLEAAEPAPMTVDAADIPTPKKPRGGHRVKMKVAQATGIGPTAGG